MSPIYIVLSSSNVCPEWVGFPYFLNETMGDYDPKIIGNPHVWLIAPLMDTVLGSDAEHLVAQLHKLMPEPAVIVPHKHEGP